MLETLASFTIGQGGVRASPQGRFSVGRVRLSLRAITVGCLAKQSPTQLAVGPKLAAARFEIARKRSLSPEC